MFLRRVRRRRSWCRQASSGCMGWAIARVLMPHALSRGPIYYAGTAEQRAGDLMAAFADPTIDGILCTRGGWGSAELLPHLDAELIRANPEGVCRLQRSHFAACVAGARGRAGDLLCADGCCRLCRGPRRRCGKLAARAGRRCCVVAGRADGLRVLRAGVAEGTLAGGCLSIFAESLGTPYAAAACDRRAPRILFLEDIGTKPYQWDRMLLHLRYAGMLEHVTRHRLRRYAAVRSACGRAAAGTGDSACAARLCRADCHRPALRPCGLRRISRCRSECMCAWI